MSPAANDPVSTGPANLPEASQDSQRTVDEPSPRSPSATPSAATRIRCPYCHSPIQLADGRPDEVLCPVCGSDFRVQDTRVTTTTSGMRQLGKFQLLERVGVGGFGAVWKARDTELDRLVALKLAHAGLLEGDADRQRFFREARAAAQLRHPNIATVHEVASLDGLPALVAEFVEGVSLRDYLQAKKFTFREAAALIAQLADALDYAHSLGIVHRDVKPGNVMLAEQRAAISGQQSAVSEEKTAPPSLTPDTCSLTPLLMDFGLALRPDAEVTLTVEGQVLGTPAYMSPEQAAGLGHRADRRSDVYSLGVVLYEMLCGEMPFRGSKAMVLHQVLHDEPRPPRRLNDKVPRDLQTICLKALAKSPARRYATARALADDLRRFLRGEPIHARPVGMLERAAKWVRRDPALAGALAAVVAVLLAGTAVSIYFGFDAQGQAELARSNESAAKQSEAEAITAQKDLARTNETLTRTADTLETTLARSLLRPLGTQSPRWTGDLVSGHLRTIFLTDAEVEALWELASTPEETLRLRFIAEGIRNARTTRQLRSRAALAVHAVVGLDSRRREELERRLGERLTAEGISQEQRIDLALTLVALGGLSAASASSTAAMLTQSMAMTADSETLLVLSQGLSAVAARMEPEKGAAALIQAMNATKNAHVLKELSQSLSAVAARMEPGKAAESRDQAAAILTQAMSSTKEWVALWQLSEGLSVVAERMEPGKAAAILTQALNSTKEGRALWKLSLGLSAVAARMEPGKAAETCAQAATILTQAMNATEDGDQLQGLSKGLSAVAARMEPRKAAESCARAAATLTQAISSTRDERQLYSLSEGLSAVTARMEPGKAAATLTQAINSTKYCWGALNHLTENLSAVATTRIAPEEAAQAAATLTQAINSTKDAVGLPELSIGLAAVAARMEPGKAAESCAQAAAILTQTMNTTEDGNQLYWLSKGLSAVAARMEPEKAAATLTQAMNSTKNVEALFSLSQGLSAVGARMEPRKAAEVCARAAATLTQALNTNKEWRAFPRLAEGLAEVAGRMEPGKGAATLTQAMNSTKDRSALGHLAQGLSAVAARMEPEKGAAALIQVMNSTKDAFALRDLSKGLAVVAARMEAGKAAESCAQAAAILTQAMNSTGGGDLNFLSLGLSAVASQMEPEKAAESCAQAAAILTQALNTTKDANALWQLSQGLSAVAGRMEPGKAAAILTQALTTTQEWQAWYYLSKGLAVVAARMEPGQAAESCARAAATLTPVMHSHLANAIASANTSAVAHLSESLSALLAGVDHSEQERRIVALTGALGRAADGYGPLACLPLLRPALEPLPCRLSTQQLVELLKHPLFVNQAQRMVLDQLDHRYGRHFADIWEFVAYAQEHEPNLDLTTPPQRPRP